MLYQPTAEQVREVVRSARKVERTLAHKGGSFIDPVFALAKMREIIASGESFVMTDELMIELPALKRPTLAELRTKYSWIREEGGIERDTSPEGPVTLRLAKVTRPSEEFVSGSEYERRLAPHHPILLGYQHREYVLAHQDEYAALMALLGKVYIDFSGLVVVSVFSDRFVPYAGRRGQRFGVHWGWFRNDVNQGVRLAISGKQQ